MPPPSLPVRDTAQEQDIGLALGDRFRQRRKALGLTLQTVAEQAGLTTGFISQVERGLASPSLSSLNAISRVLDLDPLSFVALPPSPGIMTQHGKRPLYGIMPGALAYERVSVSFPGNVLRAVIIHEPPGHRSEPISHEGEELFFILTGALTVELEGQRHVLNAGDTIHFASTRVHSTWNHTTGTTTMLHTCTMDVFGDARLAAAHLPQAATLNDDSRDPGRKDLSDDI